MPTQDSTVVDRNVEDQFPPLSVDEKAYSVDKVATHARFGCAGLNTAILALDLGTKCGYALRKRDGTLVHGTEVFTPRASWSAGQKWSRFSAWLSSTIVEGGATVIAYEDVKNHAGVLAAHAYGGFLAMMEMVADQHNLTLQPVGVGVVKRSWTGNGAADKDTMIAQAKVRGFRVVDDNNADALAILHWAIKAERGENPPSTPKPKKKKPVAKVAPAGQECLL